MFGDGPIHISDSACLTLSDGDTLVAPANRGLVNKNSSCIDYYESLRGDGDSDTTSSSTAPSTGGTEPSTGGSDDPEADASCIDGNLATPGTGVITEPGSVIPAEGGETRIPAAGFEICFGEEAAHGSVLFTLRSTITDSQGRFCDEELSWAGVLDSAPFDGSRVSAGTGELVFTSQELEGCEYSSTDPVPPVPITWEFDRSDGTGMVTTPDGPWVALIASNS